MAISARCRSSISTTTAAASIIAAALAAKFLPFTLFETRRLVGALVGILGLLVTWRLGRRLGGPLAGLIALVLLATCPLYVGHMFMNPKDSPFAVAMAMLLLGAVRVVEEYPRPSAATLALVGIGFGLSFGSRIMGAFGAIEALAALAFRLGMEARSDGLRPALGRFGRFALAMVPAVLLAYLVMALVWPWSVVDPLNPFRAVGYFSHFFEKPWEELFGGVLISVPDMPRSYVPTLLALKLPEMLLLLGSVAPPALSPRPAGGISLLHDAPRCCLLLLAATLPLAVTVALRPAMYNGIRHFVFVLPPLAVLGGLARACICSTRPAVSAASRPLLLLAALAAATLLPVVGMVRLHPYEYTYFNRLAGGVARRARPLHARLLGALVQAGVAGACWPTRRAARDAGRPTAAGSVAVCGPHRSPQVELGPDFETTWDPQGADFAMMLGEFYCRTFDAPLLVEIVRDGVVYARVYDIRGRSFPTLLTRPGL